MMKISKIRPLFNRAAIKRLALGVSLLAIVAGCKDTQFSDSDVASPDSENIPYFDDSNEYPVDRDRALTPREKALVEGIFGDEIKISKIRIEHSIYLHTTAAMIMIPKEHNRAVIKTYGSMYRSDNYYPDINNRIEVEHFNFSAFIHEILHVWQYQNAANSDSGAAWYGKSNHTDDCTYETILTENSKFKDFCIEGQAAIIQDYASFFLYSNEEYLYWNDNTVENREHVKRMVEERFPGVIKLRESVEEYLNEELILVFSNQKAQMEGFCEATEVNGPYVVSYVVYTDIVSDESDISEMPDNDNEIVLKVKRGNLEGAYWSNDGKVYGGNYVYLRGKQMESLKRCAQVTFKPDQKKPKLS